MHRTVEVTRYSEYTVRTIVAEKIESSGVVFMSQPKCYRAERQRIDPDDFETGVLRHTIYEFYREKKFSTLSFCCVFLNLQYCDYL